jgi:hypothetical protein
MDYVDLSMGRSKYILSEYSLRTETAAVEGLYWTMVVTDDVVRRGLMNAHYSNSYRKETTTPDPVTAPTKYNITHPA